MRRVTYAGESFVTTDDVADALFDFIAALDRGSAGESIEIPALTAVGEVQSVRMLVWPGSELFSVDYRLEQQFDESTGDAIAAELRDRSARLHAVRTNSAGGPSSWSLVDPDDLHD
jgi:hypothetical protein